MERTIWLARHGNRQDLADPDWVWTAQYPHDPPLSPDGAAQARQLARRLEGEGIGRIFCSPFLRALQTAKYVADSLKLPLCIEDGLGEGLCYFSAPPILLPLAVRAQYFPQMDPDYRSIFHPKYPETPEEAQSRSGAAALRIAEDYPDENLLIVGHGVSVVGGVKALLAGTEVFQAPLCCLFKLVRAGDVWRLELNGDVSHLEDPKASYRSVYTG